MSLQPIRKIVAPEIPDKLYFRIGDVAQLCQVPAYVLRFWETEFPQLKPNKGGTGQRLYRKRDVEMALRIKSLLYDQGYTIPGARQVFKNEVKERELAAPEPFAATSIADAPGMSITPVADVPGMPAAKSISPARLRSAEPSAAAAEERLSPSRRVLLEDLRAEMLAVLALLGPAPAITPAAAQPMRPRLMLEPRPAARRDLPRAETLQLVRDPHNQGDLFVGE